jgi:hypothetical protein
MQGPNNQLAEQFSVEMFRSERRRSLILIGLLGLEAVF